MTATRLGFTRGKKIALVVCILVILTALAFLLRGWLSPPRPDIDQEAERAFAGTSDQLQRTSLLPTLDEPIPDNRSSLWCASLQLAWNRLKADLAKGPVRLRAGQLLADRLNNSPVSENDLSSREFFALVGLADEGIAEKIRAGLEARFPGNTMPAIETFPQGVVAFGYLKADVRYSHQFLDVPDWLEFRGSDGKLVRVRSFGLPDYPKDPVLGGCRDQVRVLFRDEGRFAVDLSHASSPNQVVLAKMPRKQTLNETLQELARKTTGVTPAPLRYSASLMVPNMNWRIEHRFAELEGQDKEFLNPSLEMHYLARVFQFIDFKMDRKGASVESGAYAASALLNGDEPGEDKNPDHFWFDRPFLLVMKKRSAAHPFFVMWVDNAELLSKR